MSDETPVPGERSVGDHLAGYRLVALAGRPALAGIPKPGRTPRQFAPEPGGTKLLVVDTDSGQVPACQIAQLP